MEERSLVTCLDNDSLTKILYLLLNSHPMQSDEQLKLILCLSLVCRKFHQLLGFTKQERVELKPFYSVKKQWLDTVGALLHPKDANYDKHLAYYKDCALSVHITKNGPTGYPVDTLVMSTLQANKGPRLDHFNSLNYLECQYLYLTEFATFNKNQAWCYDLLEKLRTQLLNKVIKQKHAFDWMRRLTNNEKKHKPTPANIDKEHTVYLNCALLLVSEKPIKEHYERYDFGSKPQPRSQCTIL